LVEYYNDYGESDLLSDDHEIVVQHPEFADIISPFICSFDEMKKYLSNMSDIINKGNLMQRNEFSEVIEIVIFIRSSY
jgi:hypothetical protein